MIDNNKLEKFNEEFFKNYLPNIFIIYVRIKWEQ